MCCSNGLLKRFIPFFLTFAAGLLIASFFVPILPNLSFRGGRRNHSERDRQREVEVQRLLDENYNLKLQLEEMRKNQTEDNWDGHVSVMPLLHELPAEPPPPPMPPTAPAAPRKAR